MAVALTPMPVIDAGRVDVSAPNESGLGGLARSLDVTVRSVAEIGQIAQENEFKNVQSLLNDATMGPDEAKEIAGNAFFPINRFAAQNRAGEARVHAERNAIEDDLAKAVDSIDARQRLRAHQQRIMEGENELGVQAGIRQAIADLAGPMINKASATRLELRNRQRRNDESFILRETLIKDPDTFVTSLQGILADQQMDATQEPDVHETAAQTLLNTLIENPPSVVAVKEAAQAVLASGAVVNAKDRALYTGVLKAVERVEDDTNTEASTAAEKKRMLNFYGLKITDHLRLYPGSEIPEALARGYRENSTDPLTADGKLRAAMEAAKGSSIGIVGTDAHKNGKKTLDRLFAASMTQVTTPEGNEIKASAYELYDAITGSIDPRVAGEPAEAALQAQQAAQVAHDRAKAFSEATKTAATTREARRAEIDEAQIQAVMAGDMATIRKLEEELTKIDSESMLQSRRGLIRGVIDYAEQTGIDMQDLRP